MRYNGAYDAPLDAVVNDDFEKIGAVLVQACRVVWQVDERAGEREAEFRVVVEHKLSPYFYAAVGVDRARQKGVGVFAHKSWRDEAPALELENDVVGALSHLTS